MKKFLALLLACVLVMSLGISAFAAGSPVAPSYQPNKTSALPTVLSKGAKLTEYGKLTNLDADAQKAFKDAKAAVKDGAPEGMSSRYLCYVEADSYPYDLVVEMDGVNDAAAKLYADGSWSDLAVKANGNEYTITITGPGPLSIYTK